MQKDVSLLFIEKVIPWNSNLVLNYIDDKGVLEYILSQLGVGIIRVDRNGTSVTYKVSNQKELALIVALFSKYSLNTTKHLNFLAFDKAYNLYMTNKSLIERGAIASVLKGLKDSMNSPLREEKPMGPLPHW